MNKTKTISEWADCIGMNRGTLSGRYQRGLRVDKLFDTTNCIIDKKI